MKLVHVVPHVNEEASGPSYSVPRLCQSLAARGHDVELSCLAARGEIPGVVLDVHPQWHLPKRLAVSFGHARTLHHKARCADIVHNHSLWSMVNMAAGWVVPGKHAKLVTSPRGTLSPWARSRSKAIKRLLWPLQRRALARADLLHATSEGELAQIRALGFTAPVAVIPNGIDLPELIGSKPGSDIRTLLFLGRIHPTKCVDRLLRAWKTLQEHHPDWRLVIAGPGDPAYMQDLHVLATSLALERIHFTGPVYGVDKFRVYREAELFVLPSHSENFGMAVAEALAHGCPAVVSRGAPWAGLVTEGCGWWVDHAVAPLTTTLHEAMALSPPQLAGMGLKGREWMARDFGWDSVARRMEDAYRWTLQRGDRPYTVQLD
jgi:glycosyltransferase involved in cell wall biosynthesis